MVIVVCGVGLSVGLSVGGSGGRLVNLLVCNFVSPHVFSRTVAAVDTKRGYVGMCNGRSAQQESGAALSKNSMFTAGAKTLYSYYTRCALIRDRQPITCWGMTLHVQLRQKQRVSGK